MSDILKLKLNVEKIRQDFPILNQIVNGKRLIYFDSAATAQCPLFVIETMNQFYRDYKSNVHRAAHKLAAEATEKFEESRKKVADFVNARAKEIVFTRGATEAINLVLYSYALENLQKGDEIISSVMEHHSNLVPWQVLQRKGVKLNFVDIKQDGTLNLEQLKDMINNNTKLVSITHASNVLGTINPAKEIGKIAHNHGALFLVDAAQSVPHMPVNVKDIDADFLVFSGHKMLGPTGIGCLYGKADILNQMTPFNYGGEMIKEVYLRKTVFNDIPHKFEAGTPDIAGAIGLGAAVDYLERLGMHNIREHEKELVSYALERLSGIKGLRIFGPTNPDIKGGVVSFTLGDIHGHDLTDILDSEGIAVRSGQHCAMPLHDRLGIPVSTRASFYIYNTEDEIDKLVLALEKARKVFRL